MLNAHARDVCVTCDMCVCVTYSYSILFSLMFLPKNLSHEGAAHV